MNDIVIKAENLGKKYTIGHQAESYRYTALRDVLMQNARRMWHKSRDIIQGKPIVRGDTLEELWALKDVSFEIPRGEAVGIIGRNGAGKSTLLKVLGRITEPSTGRVTIQGRVSSLLEVGTGFHPELTGRENIYLNGTILGMTRQEIRRKFDEVVAFAGVEKFLDTPVKRYSSGMYVRLAFAVAAHLEPEILLVDEVLAVGDAEFQQKCLGKIGEVTGEGRTVLFVSHNMAAVVSLCHAAYWFDQGRVVYQGITEDVVTKYLAQVSLTGETALNTRIDRAGDGSVRLMAIHIESDSRESTLRCGDRLRIRIDYTAQHTLLKPTFLICIYDEFNRPIFFLDSGMTGGIPDFLPASGVVTCTTGRVNIAPGFCGVNVAILAGGVLADHVKHATTFNIQPDDFYGTGKLTNRREALCLIRQKWQAEVPNEHVTAHHDQLLGEISS